MTPKCAKILKAATSLLDRPAIRAKSSPYPVIIQECCSKSIWSDHTSAINWQCFLALKVKSILLGPSKILAWGTTFFSKPLYLVVDWWCHFWILTQRVSFETWDPQDIWSEWWLKLTNQSLAKMHTVWDPDSGFYVKDRKMSICLHFVFSNVH